MKNGTPQLLEPFSYVDAACGFAYFNLIPEKFNKNIIKQIKEIFIEREPNRQKFVNAIIEICELPEFKNIFFHEWHHCLQNIFYPFRYLQSWRELNFALQSLSYLTGVQEQLISDYALKFRNTLLYSSMIHGIDVTPDKRLKMVQRTIADMEITDITLIDMIEDATSIFEFKVEIGEEGDGERYKKWIKEKHLKKRSVYTKVFNLLCKVMDIQDAYVVLAPLVQASFYTTWPPTAFARLVNFTIENIPTEGLDSKAFYEILDPKSRFTRYVDFPNPNGQSEDDAFSFLNIITYKKIVEQTPKHTVYPLANRYLEILSKNPEVETYLFHPYDSKVQSFLLKEFLPVVTIIRVHNNLMNAQDSLFLLNPKLNNETLSIDSRVTYENYLLEIMRRKDLAYSLFTDINNILEHNCHHINCPYYPTNICRRWISIPKEFSNCPFPKWFTKITGRTLNIGKENEEQVNGNKFR